MPTYLVYCANSHADFRRQELESLAELHDIPIDLSNHSLASPFFTLSLPSDDSARLLVSRSVLTRGIYQLIAQGDSYDALHDALKRDEAYPFPQFEHVSFKFVFEAFESKRSQTEQRKVIDGFSHLGWKGKIEMKCPDQTFAIMEEWEPKLSSAMLQTTTAETTRKPRRVFFARHVGSTSRHLVSRYDLKRRPYLGTTSMDSELSLVSSNQVLARPSSLIYDPFMGTGSFLITSAAFGAQVIGSDIDGRQISGHSNSHHLAKQIGKVNVTSNFTHYDLIDLLLDCLVFDMSHPPWHVNFKVSGMIGDPPYGVRAGAKTLGRPTTSKFHGREAPLMPDGSFVHRRENYIPPKKQWELSDLANGLVRYALQVLEDGGRLAFWLPTVNEDFETVDLPVCEGMQLIAHSTQDFGKWSRRLLTYRKRPRSGDEEAGEKEEEGKEVGKGKVSRKPGHADFRGKYYARFGQTPTTPTTRQASDARSDVLDDK